MFYTLAPGAAEGEPGPGRWRPATLAIRTPMDLQAGDCELVEQFRDSVLKKMFTIRNLQDRTTCVPHQESGSLIDVRFDTFAAAPGGAASVAPAAPAAQVYAYPKQGQTAAQQAKDRTECEAIAAAQSGQDPPAARATALSACLAGRGYSVR